MKTLLLYFSLFSTICLFFSVNTVIAQDNIPWLNDYTSEITVGSNTCSYSFKTIDNNQCKISIEEKKTDKKGVTTTMVYQFYLSDLNTSIMNFKTSGSTAIVNLEIKQSQKFIRVFKNGVLDGYIQKVVVEMSEIEKARSFIDVMKSNAEKCKSTERKWATCDETMKWMIQNITKSETSGTIYEQSFKAGEKNYLACFETVSTDQKGVKQNLTYDFNINDINPVKINMEVSGKTFRIELPVRENNYYIRFKKGTEEISYVKAFEIFSDDLEQARNILNGFVYLVNETPAPVRKKWDSYAAALGFVKDNISDAKSGTSVIGQTFSFDASKSGIAQFTTTKTDSKNVTAKNCRSFYLTDIQPSVNVEVSAKTITINLLTKDKNKFIKESNDNNTLAFSSSIEIIVTDIEKARELAHALGYAIENSEKGLQEFGSVDKATNWMKSTVGEVKIDAEKISQTINFVNTDENKIELKCLTTNESGTSVAENYEIYPEDLKVENIKIKVSGKKLAVVISTGKLKYIKNDKDKVLQNYTSDTEILFDDVLKAKNFISAITLLREKSQVADRTMKDKAAALAFIIEHTTKLEVAGTGVDQKMETRDNDPCKGKLTKKETNSKGVTVENIFEFIMSDVDQENSTIEVSSKNLTVSITTKNKQKLIKPYKNGEAGNFISSIEINVDNVIIAKKLLAAFGSLSNFCK